MFLFGLEFPRTRIPIFTLWIGYTCISLHFVCVPVYLWPCVCCYVCLYVHASLSLFASLSLSLSLSPSQSVSLPLSFSLSLSHSLSLSLFPPHHLFFFLLTSVKEIDFILQIPCQCIILFYAQGVVIVVFLALSFSLFVLNKTYTVSFYCLLSVGFVKVTLVDIFQMQRTQYL